MLNAPRQLLHSGVLAVDTMTASGMIGHHIALMPALDDVTVLDLSHALAGPFASTMLGDYGADIIKIEPLDGEISCAWAPSRVSASTTRACAGASRASSTARSPASARTDPTATARRSISSSRRR